MTTPSPVPDSFLGKVLNEFGLQWTHLAIFSGLAFSSFGLDKYLNTGVWMLTIIAAFTFVFLFRREVPGHFPMVTLLSALCGSGVLVAGFAYAQHYRGGASQYLQANKVLSTVFLGLAVGLPLATMILSYRRREDVYGGNFPHEIRKAIQENLADLAFFKRKQCYEFTVLEVSRQYVKVNSVLSYILVNRTATEKIFTMTLTPMRERMEYISISVDNQNLDVDNPSYRTEHGLQVARPFPPKKEIPIRIEANVWYRPADSDLLASYLPTTEFELILSNPFPELRIVVESLFRETIEPEVDGSVRRYRSVGGSVPYQGFKLDWMPRQSTTTAISTGGTSGDRTA